MGAVAMLDAIMDELARVHQPRGSDRGHLTGILLSIWAAKIAESRKCQCSK